MENNHIASLLGMGLVALVATPFSHAQPAEFSVPAPPASQNARKFAIEEVVVTARRTEENLQEVPLSITALSSDELERQSITTAQDLMGKVGSMVIGPNATMRNADRQIFGDRERAWAPAPAL